MSANQEFKEPNLTLEKAVKILQTYGCIQSKKVESEEEKKQLCQALNLVTELSEYQNFGVCADNVQEGLSSLKSYLKALGYNANLPDLSGAENGKPVYIKFSGKSMSCYIDSYPGDYRGVLVSCYSEEQQDICGTYGHFPLQLFS
jgi:hypothetical protein